MAIKESYVISFSARTSTRAIKAILRHVQHARGSIRREEEVVEANHRDPATEALYQAMKPEAYGGSSGYYSWRPSAAHLHRELRAERMMAETLTDLDSRRLRTKKQLVREEAQRRRAERDRTRDQARLAVRLLRPARVVGNSVQSPTAPTLELSGRARESEGLSSRDGSS